MFLGNSSRELILGVLFEEWPLSAKEIYSRVSKKANKEVSYQAIHKLLLSLLDEGIIVKGEGKYFVSLDWITNTKELLSKIEVNLKASKVVVPIEQKFVFNSVHDVDKFLVASCKALNPTKKDDLALQWIHFWIPLFISRETYKEMKELVVNSNFYSITPNKSPIDLWCAKFWKDIGVKERIGVKNGYDLSFLVYKDVIVMVFYPIEIRKAIDDVYNSTDDPKKLDINNFFTTVFEKKTRIPVLVSKNKEVADELMKHIKGFFN